MAENINEEQPPVGDVQTLDKFHALTQSTGSIDKALSNNLYGLNHQQVKGLLPENRDSYGLTFFTRPQLNLQNANLRNVRQFYNLLTNKKDSVQRFVRATLDPRLAFSQVVKDADANTQIIGQGAKVTNLVDRNMAFIPVLTNTIKSMSGWPDVVMPSFTSKSGLKKEQWSIADGSIEIFEAFDLDVNFRNIKDEPIIMMMQTWLTYMAQVFEGNISPYMDFITENEIDYNTRIYRIVMDESKRYVKKIAATGASFPINVPSGKFYDYNDATKYNDQTKEINIRFKCMGAMYNDSILVKEFNETGAIFNPDIRKLLNGDNSHNLELIPYDLLERLNHRGYPIIDIDTMELTWWISKDSLTYKELLKSVNRLPEERNYNAFDSIKGVL